MRLTALLALTLTLSACDQFESDWNRLIGGRDPEARQVQVMGRTWTVSRNLTGSSGAWMAVRDNNNFDPFGRPAYPRDLQAAQAFHAATGCRVIGSSFYKNTMAEYFADLSCPK